MTKRYRFVQVDVFTGRPFGGNQLAVFPDARDLTTDEMQLLTREMNYSESTFVLPADVPGAAKRVRIFTPAKELPMAGHPTVGTAYVLASLGDLPVPAERAEAIFQLGIGLVSVLIEKRAEAIAFVWMMHRPPVFGRTYSDRALVAQALGITPADLAADWPLQVVSTGVPFLMVPVRTLAAIERCRPPSVWDVFGDVEGLYAFTTQTTHPDVALHTRMFSPSMPALEDPASGSAAAPLGAYVARYGVLPRAPTLRLICEQGIELARPSRIHVEVSSDREAITALRIGGEAVIVGEGELFW